MQTIPIFDTHAHLDREPFDEDRAALFRRFASGTFPGGLTPDGLADYQIEIVGVVLPSVDADSAERCIEIAHDSPLFRPAVAIHPNHTLGVSGEHWQRIVSLAQRDDVAAIGETGLDRYWDDSPIEVQIESLRKHINLARQTDKPILIHCRDAWDDLLPIIREERGYRGVIHAFSGTKEQMLECVELGWMISFAGSLTYRNAKFAALCEAAMAVPLDRLLIETDSPFMVPHPLRSKLQRNEPTLAALVALRLAELRCEPLDVIANTTAENAKRVFGQNSFHPF